MSIILLTFVLNLIINHLNSQKMKETDKIKEALLEAVWFMRWNETKTALSAVLDSDEAIQIIENIFEELDKAGYKIVKK